MVTFVRWSLGLALVGLLTIPPFVYYRASYAHSKRLREVEPGKVYRSGQLTAEGFAEAFQRLGIRTLINAQDEYPDPSLPRSYFDKQKTKESELCEKMGVKYIHLPPDLIPRRLVPGKRPVTIDRFLAIMDDPANYPVLIHCKAGLHRTGCLAAVYRMEYQGWSPLQAMEDLRGNGFGDNDATSANDYIVQYVLGYRRGLRLSGESGHANR